MFEMQRKTIYWFASLFITLTLIVSTTMVPNATGSAAPLNAPAGTFTPVADVYVIETSATTNYGTATNLRVDGSPITTSFLRLAVTGLNGAAVQSAVLRVYANSANTSGYSVEAVVDNRWSENRSPIPTSPIWLLPANPTALANLPSAVIC
jgi:hypothetical protein